MKKYSFRLENVRRVRRLQEEAAKAALAVANRQVRLAQVAIDAAQLHYAEVSDGRIGAAGVSAFMQQRYLTELAGQSVVAARNHKSLMEADSLVAHQTWAESAQRLKALDRLDERAREEYRIEFDRDVDREMDEINVGRASRPVTA